VFWNCQDPTTLPRPHPGRHKLAKLVRIEEVKLPGTNKNASSGSQMWRAESADFTAKISNLQNVTSVTATMTKLNQIWKSNISLPVKIELYKSLYFLFFCKVARAGHSPQNLNTESNHLTSKAMERSCVFLTKNTETHAYVRCKINMYAGKHEQLLSVIKRRKLAWYGHVTRHDFFVKDDLGRDSQQLSK
jgi:hypothetical protein